MQAKTVSLLLLSLTVACSVLLVSVEAVAIVPTRDLRLTLNGVNVAEDSTRPGVGSFQMEQQQQQQQPELRWKRGAEMALLLAHVCNQYKQAGVSPPAKYKCP